MHQKRMSMPISWRVPKKTNKWITTPNPGNHCKKYSLPLVVVIRDLLHLGTTLKEVKKILLEGKVLVDGIKRKNLKFPVGLFDVISIPEENKYYRVLQDSKVRLYLNIISYNDAMWKLCKVTNKKTLRGCIIQLNLSDGTNIIATNDYNTKDTVKLSIPQKKIIERYEYKIGNLAIISGGSHNGEIGMISKITKIKSSKKNTVLISGSENKEFETIEDYVFVIGNDKPEIKTFVDVL